LFYFILIFNDFFFNNQSFLHGKFKYYQTMPMPSLGYKLNIRNHSCQGLDSLMIKYSQNNTLQINFFVWIYSYDPKRCCIILLCENVFKSIPIKMSFSNYLKSFKKSFKQQLKSNILNICYIVLQIIFNIPYSLYSLQINPNVPMILHLINYFLRPKKRTLTIGLNASL